MAEGGVSSSSHDFIKLLEELDLKIEQNTVEINKEHFAKINPMLSDFKREQHTPAQLDEFLDAVGKVLASLKKKEAAIKDITHALTEGKCAALEAQRDQAGGGIRQSMIRSEPTRGNRAGKNDSGYHSTDSRVFTEEGHLLTSPEGDSEKYLSYDTKGEDEEHTDSSC